MQTLGLLFLAASIASQPARGQDKGGAGTVRLGIIGLDTSHVVHFTKYLNNADRKTGCRVIAAYPGGSPDIPASADRLKGFTETLRADYNVEIVDSIGVLCERVDGVLLESVDGRAHLQQARLVIEAGKPLFIDKPVAGSLADAVHIYRLARTRRVPCWSSSTWRFTQGVKDAQAGKYGDVIGCMAFGPCKTEPHHPDLYWYGVHTAETLFAVMGVGCESVTRTTSEQADVVVGKWKDGRIGIFRGGRHDGSGKGFVVFGTKGPELRAHDESYPVLLEQIIRFFKTGEVPVQPEETLQLFAFMTAADVSKARGGAAVWIDEVMRQAELEVDRREPGLPAATAPKDHSHSAVSDAPGRSEPDPGQ